MVLTLERRITVVWNGPGNPATAVHAESTPLIFFDGRQTWPDFSIGQFLVNSRQILGIDLWLFHVSRHQTFLFYLSLFES